MEKNLFDQMQPVIDNLDTGKDLRPENRAARRPSGEPLLVHFNQYIDRLFQVYERPRVRLGFHTGYWTIAFVLLLVRLETFYAGEQKADLYLFTALFGGLLMALFYGWRRLIAFISRSRQWPLLVPMLLLTHYSLATLFWVMTEAGYLYFEHGEIYRAYARRLIEQGQWTVIHSGAVLLFNLTLIGVFLIPGFLMQLVRQLFTVYRQYTRLEQEKLQIELNFLKNQINPHFFFNTLNNLFALTLQQSDKAPGMILQLSDMMRYSLYETNEDRVPLEKEIRFIQDYIDLERLRHEDAVQVDFGVEGDVNGLEMAPLILVTFIENAFKHGVRSTSQASWVDIRMQLEGPRLTFTVENNKPATRTLPGNLLRQTAGGIGIANTRKRLNLLYPGKHQLTIQDEPARYSVQLIIHLA